MNAYFAVNSYISLRGEKTQKRILLGPHYNVDWSYGDWLLVTTDDQKYYNLLNQY